MGVKTNTLRLNKYYCKYLTYKNGKYYCISTQRSISNPKKTCFAREIPIYKDNPGVIPKQKVLISKCAGFAKKNNETSSIKTSRLRIKHARECKYPQLFVYENY